MNNKTINRHIAPPQENLQIVYQQIHKNKEEIELFYAKNKTKFPPILQSRNIVIKHILPFYAQNLTQRNSRQENKKSEHSESLMERDRSKYWIQKKPSICKIQFQKSKSKKKGNLNCNPSAAIINTISHTPRKYYLSQQKSKDLKFLNEPIVKDTVIQQFIEQFNKTRSKDQISTFLLTKSFEMAKDPKKKQVQPLSINRISTLNPEAVLLDTFQGKKLTIQRSIQTERKEYNPKNTSNATYFKKHQGGGVFRKRQISQRKQGGFFEPWQQQSYIQDEYFAQMKK